MPDLKQELQTLADRRSAESTTDFDAVLHAAVARRRRRTAVASAAVAVVVVAAVITVAPRADRDTTPAPAESTAPRVPSGIEITPATARPGATVALTFPEETGRGIAFQLAKAAEPNKVLYYMTSDWGQGAEHTPRWWAAGGDGGWVDVGIGGPGPDRVVLPETAEDGTYLLCTANAVEQACGLVTVRR
ncbi:hypothetical protein [Kribbella swartbergensis]